MTMPTKTMSLSTSSSPSTSTTITSTHEDHHEQVSSHQLDSSLTNVINNNNDNNHNNNNINNNNNDSNIQTSMPVLISKSTSSTPLKTSTTNSTNDDERDTYHSDINSTYQDHELQQCVGKIEIIHPIDHSLRNDESKGNNVILTNNSKIENQIQHPGTDTTNMTKQDEVEVELKLENVVIENENDPMHQQPLSDNIYDKTDELDESIEIISIDPCTTTTTNIIASEINQVEYLEGSKNLLLNNNTDDAGKSVEHHSNCIIEINPNSKVISNNFQKDDEDVKSLSESTISSSPSIHKSSTFPIQNLTQLNENNDENEMRSKAICHTQEGDDRINSQTPLQHDTFLHFTGTDLNDDCCDDNDESLIISLKENDISPDESASSSSITKLKRYYEQLISDQKDAHNKQIDDILLQLSSIESTYSDEIATLQDKLAKKGVMCDALTTTLSEYKMLNGELERNCEACTMTCAGLEAKYNDVSAQLDEEKREVITLRQQYASLQKSFEQQKNDAVIYAQQEIQNQAETQFASAQKKFLQLKTDHQQNLKEKEILQEQLNSLNQQIENKERVHKSHIDQVQEELKGVLLELKSSRNENLKVKSMLNERMAQLQSSEKDLEEKLEVKVSECQTLTKEKHDLRRENAELQSLCEELMSIVEKGVDRPKASVRSPGQDS